MKTTIRNDGVTGSELPTIPIPKPIFNYPTGDAIPLEEDRHISGGDRYVLVARVIQAKPIDVLTAINAFPTAQLHEILYRQHLPVCLDAEKYTFRRDELKKRRTNQVTSFQVARVPYISELGDINSYEFTPNPSTEREGVMADFHAMTALAYCLVEQSLTHRGNQISSLKDLLKASDEIGIKVDVTALRTGFLILTSFGFFRTLEGSSLLSYATMNKFLSRTAAYETDLALQAIAGYGVSDPPSSNAILRYTNPRGYDTLLNPRSVGRVKYDLAPDYRYLPYLMGAHLRFIQELPSAIPFGSSVSISEIINGINQLKNYTEKVLGKSAGKQEIPEPFYSELANLMGTYNDLFEHELADLRRNPFLINNTVNTKAHDGRIFSQSDRQAAIESYLRSGRGRVRQVFDFREEVNSNDR